MPKKTLKAIAILSGTTIGAGIFGLPYVAAQVGLPIGLVYLLFLGGIILLLNLLYGEVILRTPGDHQLTSYSQIYLGKNGQALASLALFISLYGALLAYLIKIGEFLALVLDLPSPLELSLLFFCLAVVAIFFGLRTIAPLEILLMALIIAFILLLCLVGFHQVTWSNLIATNLNLQTLALPYGVILFALAGAASIPEMEEVLRRQPQKLKKAITWGSLIPFLTYFVFVCLVVGIAGQTTAEDAISNLGQILPRKIVNLGALLGILTMGSSFLTLGYVLREVWHRDFKTPKPQAVALACLPPLILFLAGAKSFISVLEITGALSGGLTGILILLLYQKAKKTGERKPSYQLKIPALVFWLLMIVFFLGMFSPLFNNL